MIAAGFGTGGKAPAAKAAASAFKAHDKWVGVGDIMFTPATVVTHYLSAAAGADFNAILDTAICHMETRDNRLRHSVDRRNHSKGRLGIYLGKAHGYTLGGGSIPEMRSVCHGIYKRCADKYYSARRGGTPCPAKALKLKVPGGHCNGALMTITPGLHKAELDASINTIGHTEALTRVVCKQCNRRMRGEPKYLKSPIRKKRLPKPTAKKPAAKKS